MLPTSSVRMACNGPNNGPTNRSAFATTSFAARAFVATALVATVFAASTVRAQSPAVHRAASTAAPPPASLFDYVRTPPSGFVARPDSTQHGISEYQMQFPSAKGGTVTGRLYVPPPNGRAPGRTRAAIVMGHGAPGSSASMGPRARYLARHGAVVLVVDAPFARRDPTQPMQFTPADSADLVQQVVDYRRALDFLSARTDVDSTRLGFVGGSHSAYVGALLAGTEPRLRALALAQGDVGYVEHFHDEHGAWQPYFDPSLPAEQVRAWTTSLAPLDARAWIGRSVVPAILLQNALHDEAVPKHAAELLHAAAPSRALRRWYDSGHRVSPPAFFDQLTFFATELGLSPATDADRDGPYANLPPRGTPAR